MKFLKKLLKVRVFIWAGVSILLVGVLIAAHLISSNYSGVIDSALGGNRPIIDETEEGITFPQDFETKEQAFDNGNKVTKEICEEGMILLKNKNDTALPLKSKAKVSVFGKNSTNYVRTEDGKKVTYGLVYGGSGSAAPGSGATGKYGKRATIYESLEAAGFSYNPELKKFYESKDSGNGRSANPAMEHGDIATLKTGETPITSYTDAIKNSYDDYGDAAIVVFSRIAGENWDLPRVAADDSNRHYLELDNNERDLLRHIGQSGKFGTIIVLINGSNYIDLGFLEERTNPTDYNDFGKYVDACINIGSPGANGIMALGEILSGKVNPSGHTVDTVYTGYQNDPTWENFGGNFVANGDRYLTSSGAGTDYYFVEYEENIYLGYRYYETRGFIEGEDWYNANVVYPFGYGLSYTTFSEEIVNKAELEAAALDPTATFNVQVKVKNTGDVAGKQVVQLYAQAPYNDGGLEKAHKVLVGFAKTEKLAKNEEETVTITVDPYYFASFDNHGKNSEGFKGYILEAGNYVFHVATDAHHDIDTFTKNLAANAKFEKDPVTHYDVEPLFDDVTNGMKESLSRADFAGTFPHRVSDEANERRISNDMLDQLKSYDSTNDETFDALPTMGAPYTVPFKSLVGKPYNDESWDQFLDQLTFDEMLKLFNDGCYSTAPILRDITVTVVDEETGEEKEVVKKDYPVVPGTTSCDGPTGLVAFAGDPAVYNCCYYCSECLVAQTYNIKLAAEEAKAIGNEALIGNEKGGNVAYPGWYAPGVNLHRSPFSGRNTEYYSEDPFLNGRMAATVIKGVQEKGVYANVKHYALNDQETHRSSNGIATWCDEQAIRELYLRPFEMAVKEGGTHGLMTSFNRVGTEWAGGSYRLCTIILRKEWGFVGSVICDYHTDSYMDSKQMLYAGGDLNLCGDASKKLRTDTKGDGDPVKPTNKKDANLIRRSAHNNLYAVVNSCAMKRPIKGYNLAYWKVGLYAGTGGIAGILAIWGAAMIVTALLAKPKVKKEAAAEGAEGEATEPVEETPVEAPTEEPIEAPKEAPVEEAPAEEKAAE